MWVQKQITRKLQGTMAKQGCRADGGRCSSVEADQLERRTSTLDFSTADTEAWRSADGINRHDVPLGELHCSCCIRIFYIMQTVAFNPCKHTWHQRGRSITESQSELRLIQADISGISEGGT